MFRVHNFWTFAGAVIGAIIIYNLWTKGQTTTSVATGAENFAVNLVKALEVKP